ncbi:MAG: hypothetical protein K2N31_09200 [Treponemataceae bacterium]|nr:hypothetical protein [Treponemataceae bacterium]
MDKHRRFAVRQKCVWTSNGIFPFVENASGQAPAFCRWSKIRSGKYRRFAVRRNSVRASTGIPPFVKMSFGQASAFCRSSKMRLDGQLRFVRGFVVALYKSPFSSILTL